MDNTERDKQIEVIVADFNWVNVHKAMKAVGWKYGGADESPTIGALVNTATRLLKEAWIIGHTGIWKSKDYNNIGSGGFLAVYQHEEGLELVFTLEHASYYDLTD